MGKDASDPTAAALNASSELQAAFARVAGPALRKGITQMLSDLGDPGTEPASVRQQFALTRDRTNADFDTAEKRTQASIEQEIKQGGGAYSPQATSEIVARQMNLLDRQRTQAITGLNFQEAQGGLDQTNFLLNTAGAAAGSAASGSISFGQNAISAGQILNRINAQNRQEGSTYGSLIGAILGSVIYPGIGTSLGAAAGGAAGGWYGGG